jgi:pimeloyl-ACP methyl ester carboxylesterase
VAKTFSRDGTAIAFDRLGSGPSIILVGGALSDRSAGAPGLAALLQPRFTVFTYDRRGRGGSGDTVPYAVAREVEDLEAVITEAGGSAFLYGVSSGAALALEAAASGLPITGLALFEPPFRVNGNFPRPPDDLTKTVEDLTSSGRRGDAVEAFLTKAVGLPPEAIAQMRNSPMWTGLEATAHTLVYDFTIMGDGSFPAERAASVTVRTLVIGSEASPPWLRQAVQTVADTLPNARPRFLAGQFHSVPRETLARVLEEFFVGDVVTGAERSSRPLDSRVGAENVRSPNPDSRP